ncbi:SH3 domain-containing protein [Streptomyces monticola]|uniref:SH3 domain-containing protein n=1 Tax=Streptomyces monticola TaxID=2666263 RepID=A0ABW2JJ10_9ACTN
MLKSRALRTFAACLLAGGGLTVSAAGTASANNDGGPIWGRVVSHGEINLRADPNTGAAIVGSLPPGSQDRIECATFGSHVNGNPYWYWLGGARGWASGAFMKPERQAPMCGNNNQGDQHNNQNHNQWQHTKDQCWCKPQDPCRHQH